MNGEYRRLIKVRNGAAEFADRCLLVIACVKKRCNHRISTGPWTVKRLEGSHQRIAQPLSQLTRRCPGIGHHQDARDWQIPLQQQAQIKRRNGPGLSRTGGRLDQIDALERNAKRIERSSTHPRASCTICAGVPKTCAASDSNSLSSAVSSRSRNARAKNGSADSPTAKAWSDAVQILRALASGVLAAVT